MHDVTNRLKHWHEPKAGQRAGFGIVTPGSFHAPYFDPYDPDALSGADYITQILFAVMMATFMFVMLPRAAVSGGRIQEVLNTESSVVPPAPTCVRVTCSRRSTPPRRSRR